MPTLDAEELRRRLIRKGQLGAKYLRPGESEQIEGVSGPMQRPSFDQDPNEIEEIENFERNVEAQDIVNKILRREISVGRSPQGAYDPGASEAQLNDKRYAGVARYTKDDLVVDDENKQVFQKNIGGKTRTMEVDKRTGQRKESFTVAPSLGVGAGKAPAAQPARAAPQVSVAPKTPVQYGPPVGDDVLIKAVDMMRNPAKAAQVQENPQGEGDLLSLALLAALPTIAGGLFGGAGGFAAGGQIGAQAVGTEVKRREGLAKEQRERLAKEQDRAQQFEQQKELIGMREQGAKERVELQGKAKIKEALFKSLVPGSGEKGTFQFRNVYDSKTGKTTIQSFDTRSGEAKLRSDAPLTGFAPQVRTDPDTGDLIQVHTPEGQKRPLGGKSSNRDLDPRQTKEMERHRERVEKSPEVREARSRISAVQEFRNMLKMSNPVADKVSKRKFLAVVSGETGRAISDYDVQSIAGARDLRSRFDQAIEDAIDGTWTEDNRKLFTQIADFVEQQEARRLNKVIGDYVDGTASTTNVPKSRIKDVTRPYEPKVNLGTGPDNEPPPSAGPSPELDQIRQRKLEIQKRKAKLLKKAGK